MHCCHPYWRSGPDLPTTMTTHDDVTGDSNQVPVPMATGRSVARRIAEVVLDGVTGNAVAAHHFADPNVADGLSLKDCVETMRDRVDASERAATDSVERMLRAQAVTLDVIFVEMAKRAAFNLDESLQTCESYLRMALRAQDQSRKTAETLATLRNPGSVVIAKAANITHGQQINIGTVNRRDLHHQDEQPRYSPNELLAVGDGERVESGKEGASGRTDTPVEAVDQVNRAIDG